MEEGYPPQQSLVIEPAPAEEAIPWYEFRELWHPAEKENEQRYQEGCEEAEEIQESETRFQQLNKDSLRQPPSPAQKAEGEQLHSLPEENQLINTAIAGRLLLQAGGG